MTNQAIVLLSGGLDSTTTLAIARSQGIDCFALTLSYGQLHKAELAAAKSAAADFDVKSHLVFELDMSQIAESALTSPSIEVPKNRSTDEISAPGDIPSTYVPARNTVFLSLALAWADTLGCTQIFIGANVLDASGYPDCRPEFLKKYEDMANVATRLGSQGHKIRIEAPLIEMTKADIIRRGMELGVDYKRTHSCYDPKEDLACGACDACILRRKGFAEAQVPDPTGYAQS